MKKFAGAFPQQASSPGKRTDPWGADYQAALIDDDGRSIHSVESRRTQSTAGFSLATKHQLPAGSYQGGADYYRDTTHSRTGSRTTFNQYPSMQSMPSFGYGVGPGSEIGRAHV